MKTMPLVLQPTIYFNGNYNYVDGMMSTQVPYSLSEAEGLLTRFMNAYSVLDNLDYMTEIVEEEENTFLFFYNDATHEPTLLQTPDYVPAERVDNRAYDAANTQRFSMEHSSLKVESAKQMSQYHVTMSAFLRLGEWFDYLREQGVYDNTRIILVADHGHADKLEDRFLTVTQSGITEDLSTYYPLLMMKDFDSQEYQTSQEFMTIADVPTLATNGLIESPVNPFTGKTISSSEKTSHPQLVMRSNQWDILVNNGTAFLPARWASVEKDLRDPANWKFYDEPIVLTEHHLPQQ